MLLGPADEFAAFQGGHEFLAGLDLARVGADEVRQRQERFDAAVIGVQGHRGDAVRPGGEPHALEEGIDGVGAHELGAVQQRQAFLGLERDGLPALFGPYLRGGADLALIQNFAQADEREAQVGEGSEVAGSAEGTLLVHDRKDVLVEHVDEPLHRDELRARMAVGQALGLEEEHQLHNLGPDGLAGAAGVGHHQVVLKLR